MRLYHTHTEQCSTFFQIPANNNQLFQVIMQMWAGTAHERQLQRSRLFDRVRVRTEERTF